MIRFFQVLGRVLRWLLRTRALRLVLGLLLLLWIFDGALTMATDAAWFSSVGLGAVWRQQVAWSLGISAVFAVSCLALSVPLLRAVARPAPPETVEPSLPRALQGMEPLRARATRVGWTVLVVAALILGRELGAHWSEFALASGPVQGDFWIARAPVLERVLAKAWAFALVAGAVVLGAGALKALPFLAARPSLAPARWMRALWGIAAVLCVLRALGFGMEAARHAQIIDEAAFARVAFVILNVAGMLGCGVLLVLSRRPRPKLLPGVAAVLVLPSIVGDVISPFARFNTSPPQAPGDFKEGKNSGEWPGWDEAMLLRAARLHLARDKRGRIIEWQNVGLSGTKGGQSWRADIVGASVLGDAWAGHDVADRQGELAWKSLDLPHQNSSRSGEPFGALSYGLDARPLLSDRGGVSFEGSFWKWAWAWRLRDPLLALDGARAKRLLVWRGAREAGQKIAPFFSWDEAVPRRDTKNGSAYFECVAYASSANFARRPPFVSGLFAGKNVAVPVAVLRVDARSGALTIAPFASTNALAATWKAAVPAVFGAQSPQNAPTPALETALSNGTPLVWMQGETGWEKRALPLSLRARVEDKLSEFVSLSRSHSQTPLEGAAPALWRKGGQLFLARTFFDLSPPNQTRIVPDAPVLPAPVGVAVGPLQSRENQWSATVAQALNSTGSKPQEPVRAPTPKPSSGVQSTHALTLEALKAARAASEALEAGRYAQWQQQNERARRLIEEVERRTR